MKKTIGFILVFVLIIQPVAMAQNDYINPSRDELERMITEIAVKRGVPAVLVMSLARIESVYRHFDEANRSVRTGSAGSIGLMQINNSRDLYDEHRLRYDIPYNIEAGIDVFLEKWEASASQSRWAYLPSVGEMDPNILENWYFALWGYNGFVGSNNPNVAYSLGRKPFQEMVYDIAFNEYDQKIVPIDRTSLPEVGTPDSSLNVATPDITHDGGILISQPGDWVRVSYLPTTSALNLRKTPDGAIIGTLDEGEIYRVSEEAVLAGGYYWYRLESEEGEKIGWAARNWLVPYQREDKPSEIDPDKEVEEIEEDLEMPFKDIVGKSAWAEGYISALYNKGLIRGVTETEFAPESLITRQDFSLLMTRTFPLGDHEWADFEDKNEVRQDALSSVEQMIHHEIMSLKENRFEPERPLTRIEAAVGISQMLKTPEALLVFDFEDVQGLTVSELESLMAIYTYGIIEGRNSQVFDPHAPVTRAEIAKIFVLSLKSL